MFYLFILLFLVSTAAAQVNPGARQSAICNADIALSDDVFSIFSNPSGIAKIPWREAGLYYSPAPFGLKELANYFFAYHEPLSFGSAGIGIMTYGYELYRENKVLLTYAANPAEGIFAGASLTWHNISIQNYGGQGTFYFNAGIKAEVSSTASLGFSITNINNATISEEEGQLPMIFNSGISVIYFNSLIIHGAVQKDLRYNFSYSAGIEYSIFDLLTIRTGTATEPARYSAGTGIHYNYFTFDYAVSLHNTLGITHQLSILISFKDFRNRQKAINNEE